MIALSDPGWTEFYLFCLSSLLLLLAGTIWYHREKGQKQRAEQMRKQIAEDFHDELGSKLTIISMYSELIRREVPQDNDLAKHYLHKITEASNGLYLAMKDMLWALDPARDRLDDLLMKIRDFGNDLFEDTSTDFTMQVPETKVQRIILPLEYKRHLLLLLKEGLHNVLRHAEATQVNLRAEINNSVMTIELRDNGRGFEGLAAQSGEGLKNMTNRARKLRAQLDITSSPAGTSIMLHCPLGK